MLNNKQSWLWIYSFLIQILRKEREYGVIKTASYFPRLECYKT